MTREHLHPSPFGVELRRLRADAGMTQEALAERSRISVDAISALESGRRQRPHPRTVSMLAEGLGLEDAERQRLLALPRAAGRSKAGARHPRGVSSLLALLRPTRLGTVWTGALLLLTTVLMGQWSDVPRNPARPSLVPRVGTVQFVSSQAQQPAEYLAMADRVLAGFDGRPAFRFEPTGAEEVQEILDEQRAGKSTVDVVGLTRSEMLALHNADVLQDVTTLLQKLQKSRRFQLTPGDPVPPSVASDDTIPWMQATYVMVINRRALQYRPPGVDVDHLTYEQLIDWGQRMRAKEGKNLIGLPADLNGPRGGLLPRFIQGYAYPSYTGGMLSRFDSPQAVDMWAMLRRLWSVTNPDSATSDHTPGYREMDGALQSGEVWIAWDHQARLTKSMADPNHFLVVPAPSGPRGRGYMSVLVSLAIPKHAPNQAGAEALVDYLTQARQEATAGTALNFSPVIGSVPASTALLAGAAVARAYSDDRTSVRADLPAGLGSNGNDFNAVYQDTFRRIVLKNEDIATVLEGEAVRLQQIVETARAPCWKPDPPSDGPCHVG